MGSNCRGREPSRMEKRGLLRDAPVAAALARKSLRRRGASILHQRPAGDGSPPALPGRSKQLTRIAATDQTGVADRWSIGQQDEFTSHYSRTPPLEYSIF